MSPDLNLELGKHFGNDEDQGLTPTQKDPDNKFLANFIQDDLEKLKLLVDFIHTTATEQIWYQRLLHAFSKLSFSAILASSPAVLRHPTLSIPVIAELFDSGKKDFESAKGLLATHKKKP